MSKNNFLENLPKYTAEELRDVIKEQENIELLSKALSIETDVEKKEIIRQRIEEIKGRKGYVHKTEERPVEYEIQFIGAGWCGCSQVLNLYKLYRERGEEGKYKFTLYDLSVDIYKNIRNKGLTEEELKRSEVDVITVGLRGGAGRVSIFAEAILKHTNHHTRISPAIYNFHFNSGGGGTGSRTIPTIIQEMKKKKAERYHIAFSVLTSEAGESLNHIYTFPMLNKEADFIILLENDAIGENMVNKQIMRIVDLLNMAREPNAHPQPRDITDFKTIFRRAGDYDRVRWVIPFIYPLEEEYGDKDMLPYEGICEALKNPLVRVDDESIRDCRAAIIIVECPESHYEKIVEEKLPDGKTIYQKTEDEIGNILPNLKIGTEANTIFQVVSGKNFCVLVLLYGIFFKKLKELVDIPDQALEADKNAWHARIDEDLKRLDTRRLNITLQESEIERIKERVDRLEFVADFRREYGRR